MRGKIVASILLILVFSAWMLLTGQASAQNLCDGWAASGSEHRNAGNGCVYRCDNGSWQGPLRCDGQGNGQFQGEAAQSEAERQRQLEEVQRRQREAEAQLARQTAEETARLAAQTEQQRAQEAARQQAMVEAQRQAAIATGVSPEEAQRLAQRSSQMVAQAAGTFVGTGIVGSGDPRAVEFAITGYDPGIMAALAGVYGTGDGAWSAAMASGVNIANMAGPCDINTGSPGAVGPGGACCRGGVQECGAGTNGRCMSILDRVGVVGVCGAAGQPDTSGFCGDGFCNGANEQGVDSNRPGYCPQDCAGIPLGQSGQGQVVRTDRALTSAERQQVNTITNLARQCLFDIDYVEGVLDSQCISNYQQVYQSAPAVVRQEADMQRNDERHLLQLAYQAGQVDFNCSAAGQAAGAYCNQDALRDTSVSLREAQSNFAQAYPDRAPTTNANAQRYVTQLQEHATSQIEQAARISHELTDRIVETSIADCRALQNQYAVSSCLQDKSSPEQIRPELESATLLYRDNAPFCQRFPDSCVSVDQIERDIISKLSFSNAFPPIGFRLEQYGCVECRVGLNVTDVSQCQFVGSNAQPRCNDEFLRRIAESQPTPTVERREPAETIDQTQRRIDEGLALLPEEDRPGAQPAILQPTPATTEGIPDPSRMVPGLPDEDQPARVLPEPRVRPVQPEDDEIPTTAEATPVDEGVFKEGYIIMEVGEGHRMCLRRISTDPDGTRTFSTPEQCQATLEAMIKVEEAAAQFQQEALRTPPPSPVISIPYNWINKNIISPVQKTAHNLAQIFGVASEAYRSGNFCPDFGQSWCLCQVGATPARRIEATEFCASPNFTVVIERAETEEGVIENAMISSDDFFAGNLDGYIQLAPPAPETIDQTQRRIDEGLALLPEEDRPGAQPAILQPTPATTEGIPDPSRMVPGLPDEDQPIRVIVPGQTPAPVVGDQDVSVDLIISPVGFYVKDFGAGNWGCELCLSHEDCNNPWTRFYDSLQQCQEGLSRIDVARHEAARIADERRAAQQAEQLARAQQNLLSIAGSWVNNRVVEPVTRMWDQVVSIGQSPENRCPDANDIFCQCYSGDGESYSVRSRGICPTGNMNVVQVDDVGNWRIFASPQDYHTDRATIASQQTQAPPAFDPTKSVTDDSKDFEVATPVAFEQLSMTCPFDDYISHCNCRQGDGPARMVPSGVPCEKHEDITIVMTPRLDFMDLVFIQEHITEEDLLGYNTGILRFACPVTESDRDVDSCTCHAGTAAIRTSTSIYPGQYCYAHRIDVSYR